MCDNQIDYVPPEIGLLQNVISLKLSRNQIEHLPSEMVSFNAQLKSH